MSEEMNSKQAQICPQCDNHCPVDALQCGKGRKYFGMADGDHEHGGCRGPHKDGLTGLLHQCGRFVRHSELDENELFQSLTAEEKATLQAVLEKLVTSWRERCGTEGFGCHRHHHGCNSEPHHQREGHGK